LWTFKQKSWTKRIGKIKTYEEYCTVQVLIFVDILPTPTPINHTIVASLLADMQNQSVV
jgi:hypothetical protein